LTKSRNKRKIELVELDKMSLRFPRDFPAYPGGFDFSEEGRR
jgi:hypothetical protein